MKPLFQSFFLLIFINLFPCLLVLFFLKLPFLIPTLALLCVFNIYLYQFHSLKILKNFTHQHFSPNDPWKVMTSFKKMQKEADLENLHCYKTKMDYPVSVCFGTPKNYSIIFSEQLLDTFSEKEIKLLLSYYFQAISRGSILFLTLLSGIIYCMDRLLFVLNSPLRFFQKNKSINFLRVWNLSIWSWLTRPLFLKLDRQFMKTEKEKRLWASFLWKVDSLYKQEKRNFPTFFAPVFLTNPLTNIKSIGYTFLHPKIRSRVKNLIGSYPP